MSWLNYVKQDMNTPRRELVKLYETVLPRRLFCFGSLVVLDVACGYVLLFLLDIKIANT